MSENEPVKIKAGDSVHHNPSNEDWVVAYVDYEDGSMSWLGWPEGRAKISDCKLTRSCSEEKSLEVIMDCAKMRNENGVVDCRKSRALVELHRREMAHQCRCCNQIYLEDTQRLDCENRHRKSREYLFAMSEMETAKSGEE